MEKSSNSYSVNLINLCVEHEHLTSRGVDAHADGVRLKKNISITLYEFIGGIKSVYSHETIFFFYFFFLYRKVRTGFETNVTSIVDCPISTVRSDEFSYKIH